MPNEIMLFAVSVGISVASFTDVTRFKVYNLLTFPLMLSAFVFHTLNAGIGGLGLSLAGCFLALGILLAPYLLGGLGAGDVKFMMALGAWIGPNLVLPTVLIGSLAVTAYFFASVYRQRGWRSLFDEAQLLLARLSNEESHSTIYQFSHRRRRPHFSGVRLTNSTYCSCCSLGSRPFRSLGDGAIHV